MTCEKGWDEMRRGQMRWHEVKRNQMIWDRMSCGMWSASVKREVQGVKSAVWSVKKMYAWCCNATWSHAGHVLGPQQCNKLAQSKHARRTARANSIDEKGFIIKSKATSAPPRAGTTGTKHKSHFSEARDTGDAGRTALLSKFVLGKSYQLTQWTAAWRRGEPGMRGRQLTREVVLYTEDCRSIWFLRVDTCC